MAPTHPGRATRSARSASCPPNPVARSRSRSPYEGDPQPGVIHTYMYYTDIVRDTPTYTTFATSWGNISLPKNYFQLARGHGKRVRLPMWLFIERIKNRPKINKNTT